MAARVADMRSMTGFGWVRRTCKVPYTPSQQRHSANLHAVAEVAPSATANAVRVPGMQSEYAASREAHEHNRG